MDKKVTVAEFKRYCEDFRPLYYVYATINQKGNNMCNIVQMTSIYKSVDISLAPNRVMFMNGRSVLCFNRVKHVIIKCKKQGILTAFDIVCRSLESDNEETYTIVADIAA